MLTHLPLASYSSRTVGTQVEREMRCDTGVQATGQDSLSFDRSSSCTTQRDSASIATGDISTARPSHTEPPANYPSSLRPLLALMRWMSGCGQRRSDTKNKFVRKAFLHHLVPFCTAFLPVIAVMRLAEECAAAVHPLRLAAQLLWLIFIASAPWVEFESLVPHFFAKTVK